MKPLVITASGACTPVGTRAWLTACALNAHQSAFTRIQMPDHIDHRATGPRHPWANGQVERMKRTIKGATVKRFYYETCHHR